MFDAAHHAASLLGTPGTCVLVVHGDDIGATLAAVRSELVPHLAYRHRILDLPTEAGDPPDPMERVARAVHAFASTPYVLRTPLGVTTMDLTEALGDHQGLGGFMWSPGIVTRLVETLRHLARLVPDTLVPIVPLDSMPNPAFGFPAVLRNLKADPYDVRFVVATSNSALPEVAAAMPFAKTAPLP